MPLLLSAAYVSTASSMDLQSPTVRHQAGFQHSCPAMTQPQSDCKPPDSWLYQYTRHGLDPMVQQYLEYGLTINQYQYMVRPGWEGI